MFGFIVVGGSASDFGLGGKAKIRQVSRLTFKEFLPVATCRSYTILFKSH